MNLPCLLVGQIWSVIVVGTFFGAQLSVGEQGIASQEISRDEHEYEKVKTLNEALEVVKGHLRQDGKPEYAALLTEARVREAIRRSVQGEDARIDDSEKRYPGSKDYWSHVAKPVFLRIADTGEWAQRCSFIGWYTMGRDRGLWVLLFLDVPKPGFGGHGLAIVDLYFGKRGVQSRTSESNAFAADSPDDAKAVQGSWAPVKGEFAGQPMDELILKTISLKLDNGEYHFFAGGLPDKGTYTIDSTTKPKSMTVTGTEGPNKGKTYPAIYELKGDSLRICYDVSGANRPTEFKSITGTQLSLVTYNRKKE